MTWGYFRQLLRVGRVMLSSLVFIDYLRFDYPSLPYCFSFLQEAAGYVQWPVVGKPGSWVAL